MDMAELDMAKLGSQHEKDVSDDVPIIQTYCDGSSSMPLMSFEAQEGSERKSCLKNPRVRKIVIWSSVSLLLLGFIVSISLLVYHYTEKTTYTETGIYLGCYVDGPESVWEMNRNMGKENEPSKCIAYCSSLGYSFAAMQSGTQCLCGNSRGAYNVTSNEECDSPCPSSRHQMCGGSMRNSVYSTALSPYHTTTTTVDSCQYIGCYIDREFARDLSEAFMSMGNYNRPSTCVSWCKAAGYSYAGLQSYTLCYCGNSYGLYGQVGMEKCDSPCLASPNEMCGADLRNSVYHIDSDPSSDAESVEDLYLGCFNDNDGERDLPNMNDLDNSNKPSACIEWCKIAGFRYAALQYTECWCGNSYGRYGPADATACDKPCPASPDKKCGGSKNILINSVYSIRGNSSYLGCYKDDPVRDLPIMKDMQEYNEPSACSNWCRASGYKYAGLQNATQCFCGDNFGRYGEVSSAECDASCPASSDRKCGGSMRNSIYSTGSEVVCRNNTAQSSTTVPPLPENGTYLGCYKDDPVRDLPMLHTIGDKNKPSTCIELCRSSGYKYAGLQYTTQCFCGNNFGTYGEVSSAQCDASCPASPDRKCGGSMRNSIYATGVDVVSETTTVQSSTTVEQLPGSYLGCYPDYRTRDLPIMKYDAEYNKPSTCIICCRASGYRYAGLQDGTQCFCGYTFGMYGELNSTWCDSPCPASPEKKCGGFYKNSIYSTELDIVSETTTVQSSTTVEHLPGKSSYLGCYEDDYYRALPTLKDMGKYNKPSTCINWCRNSGYKYAGLQYTTQCFCGDNFRTYVEVNSTNCDHPCPASPDKMCGGYYMNSIYSTGVDVVGEATTQQSSTTAPYIPENGTYLGCYKDDPVRDLPMLHTIGDKNKPSICIELCRSSGYKYAGLQYTTQCFCGDNFGTYDEVSSAECDASCPAAPDRKCGGSMRNSIYATGVGIVSEATTVQSSTTVSQIPDPSGYLGCFIDNETRDLPVYKDLGYNNKPTACIDFCKSIGYKYAGVEHSTQCFCGDSYGFYGKVDSAECNYTCPASRDVNCGGLWRISVYETKYSRDEDKYVGCYIDSDPRDITWMYKMGDKNKPSACMSLCKSVGYKYVGLQNGNECYCGNTYGAYGKVDSSECSYACPANPQQTCGGKGRNSVYTTGYVARQQYLGCYVDGGRRDLEHQQTLYNKNEPSACIDYCISLGYMYAGLQDQTSCFCGNTYGSYAEADITECYQPCPASPQDKCGGSWRNSVYETRPTSTESYLGCYIDGTERDLPILQDMGDNNKPSACIDWCKDAGYKYVGLQNGTECYCGDAYGTYSKVDSKQCEHPCPASPNMQCGGLWRNSVYKTGYKTEDDKYLGCYLDGPQRDLPEITDVGSNNNPTVCIDLCKSSGYKYAGLQDSTQCCCGNSYGSYAKTNSTACNGLCLDTPSEVCGSSYKNSVYSTGYFDKEQYLGCYVDGNVRDLSYLKHMYNKNEPSICIDYCQSLGYMYAGLQNETLCFCGNKYGSYHKALGAGCDIPCPASPDEKCGGLLKNSVYRTNINRTENASYLGCYVDGSSPRDLPIFRDLGDSNEPSTCIQLCKSLGYKYAGVEHSTQCFCGDSYGFYGKIDITECNYTCPASRDVNCGGLWRNSVYKTGYEISYWKYLGCYVDKPERDLAKLVVMDQKNKPTECMKLCKSSGYKFAGLQNGTLCFCGNSYGSYGQADSEGCNTTCPASSAEICGGIWRNSIYKTGYVEKEMYLGCYVDSSPSGSLSLKVMYNRNEPSECIEYCKARGNKYAGLQDVNKCYCGNHFYSSDLVSDSECNDACPESPGDKCGGLERRSVYKTEKKN